MRQTLIDPKLGKFNSFMCLLHFWHLFWVLTMIWKTYVARRYFKLKHWLDPLFNAFYGNNVTSFLWQLRRGFLYPLIWCFFFFNNIVEVLSRQLLIGRSWYVLHFRLMYENAHFEFYFNHSLLINLTLHNVSENKSQNYF